MKKITLERILKKDFKTIRFVDNEEFKTIAFSKSNISLEDDVCICTNKHLNKIYFIETSSISNLEIVLNDKLNDKLTDNKFVF